jgi:hypothetical protein
VYVLFAPIAGLKTFEDKLITMDQNLNRNVTSRYKLGKELFLFTYGGTIYSHTK